MTQSTRRSFGFTLIELMITVAIIGILAAIAYPSYTSSVQKGRRSDGIVALQQIMSAQEKWRVMHTSYGRLSDLGISSKSSDGYYTSSDGYYTLAISGNTASTYTATATATGSQSSDTNCRKLIVTLASGNITETSENSAGSASTDCWKK